MFQPRPFSGVAECLEKAATKITVFDKEIKYAPKLRQMKLLNKAVVDNKPIYKLTEKGRKVLEDLLRKLKLR